jgi:hypothetical protein
VWGGRGNLLEIIEQQEHTALSQVLSDAFPQGNGSAFFDSQCLGDAGYYEVRVAQGGKGHEKDPIFEFTQHLLGSSQRQSSLADAPWAR